MMVRVILAVSPWKLDLFVIAILKCIFGTQCVFKAPVFVLRANFVEKSLAYSLSIPSQDRLSPERSSCDDCDSKASRAS